MENKRSQHSVPDSSSFLHPWKEAVSQQRTFIASLTSRLYRILSTPSMITQDKESKLQGGWCRGQLYNRHTYGIAGLGRLVVFDRAGWRVHWRMLPDAVVGAHLAQQMHKSISGVRDLQDNCKYHANMHCRGRNTHSVPSLHIVYKYTHYIYTYT